MEVWEEIAEMVHRCTINKNCQAEILDTIDPLSAEDRPIWNPMHRIHEIVSRDEIIRSYIASGCEAVDADIVNAGVLSE